jgi:hypothetical protein
LVERPLQDRGFEVVDLDRSPGWPSALVSDLAEECERASYVRESPECLAEDDRLVVGELPSRSVWKLKLQMAPRVAATLTESRGCC